MATLGLKVANLKQNNMKGFYNILESMLPVNKGKRFAELGLGKFKIGWDDYPITANIEIVLNEGELRTDLRFIELKIMADGETLFGFHSAYNIDDYPPDEAKDRAAYKLMCNIIKTAFYKHLEERAINASSGA